MEFRRQEEGYNPPPLIRESAFTRPLPSLSSPPSLLSPRGGLTARNGGLPATPNPPPKDPDPVPAAAAPAGATTGGGGSIPKAVATTVAAAASEADAAVRYRECLRNHAASLGGHVLDGCGEFMPGGDAGTQEAMKCAACGCHRSFHRKEADRERSPFYRLPNGGHSRVPLLLPPPPPHHPQHHHHHHPHPHKHFPTCFPPSPPAIVASGGTTTESSSEERNAGVTTAATAAAGGAAVFAPPSKKRHRTKFTAEQKERMLGFAQSVGWRIQKQDEGEMERFCAEIGISRQVLKVWMHNNKHSIRRPQHQLEQHHQDQHQHQHQLQQQQP